MRTSSGGVCYGKGTSERMRFTGRLPHAVHEASRCWHEAYRLSFMAVATRVGSARAALAFFLPMAPHSAPPPVPEGGGGRTPVPEPQPA